MEGASRRDPTLPAVVRTLASDALAAEVIGAMRSAGVRALLLKGRGLSELLDDANSVRTYVDTDLLVAPDQVAEAEAVLRGLGFTKPIDDADMPGWALPAHHWLRRRDRANVDLHHTLYGVRVPPEDCWRALAGDTDTVQLARLEVEVPSAAARAMHLALHGAQHGVESHRRLDELARALRVIDRRTWWSAARLAERLEAAAAFAKALELLPDGRALLPTLELSPERTVEAELLAASPPPLAVGLQQLASTSGVRAKSRLLLSEIFPSRRFMRGWSRLATRGRRGLAAAYLWRLIYLAIHAGPAFRSWRAAAARTKSGGPPGT